MKIVRAIAGGLVLALVFVISALLTMRIAIHGHEVQVPKLAGLTLAEAQHEVHAAGLRISLESGFYSADIPAGRVLSQLPPPGTMVRQGWQVRISPSLGAERVIVPDLVGQSRRTAELNLQRRGLEVGSVATMQMAGVPADHVLAQSPGSGAAANSPKIDLLISR